MANYMKYFFTSALNKNKKNQLQQLMRKMHVTYKDMNPSPAQSNHTAGLTQAFVGQ